MLALIKNGDVIAEVSEGGWFSLPDGQAVSPAEAGWELTGWMADGHIVDAGDLDGETPPAGWTAYSYKLVAIAAADPVPAGKRLVTQSVSYDGEAARYVQTLEDIPAADLWASARQTRNQLLAESDWTQLSDTALTSETKSAWAIYRQALRDITAQPDPLHIVWPIEP